jgi:hypothetical protein
MLHLLMAACWLILGGVLLAWQGSNPAVPSTSIWGTGISLGWFAIAMALYNLLRWWLGRSSSKATRPGLEESPLRRGRAVDSEQNRTVATPDPSFDFTRDPSRPR